MNNIEINPNIYFKPNLSLFEQNQECIDFINIIKLNNPINTQFEYSENEINRRIISQTWVYGDIQLILNKKYLNDINSNNFLTLVENDEIIINFLTNE